METFSALLALCAGSSSVTGEFPSQVPVTRSFDVFFDLYLSKRLSKQSWGWWFKTQSRSLWRHCSAWDCPGANGATQKNMWKYIKYPTLAREFQGFRVWGKFVFRTLELTDTPTNLANQVKVGHALIQSRSVQSRGPERAHQNNEPSWRSSTADRRLSKQFWDD